MKGSVRKRPSGKWSYYFSLGKVDGKVKKRERGGFDTEQEAREALEKDILEFKNCGKIFDETKMSIDEFLQYWYDDYVLNNCKYNTQDLYERFIRLHIRPFIGHYKLKDMTTRAYQDFFTKLYKEGYSKALLKRIHAILSTSLKMAIFPYEFLKINSFENVSIKHYRFDKVKEVKSLTLDEIRLLLAFAKENRPDYHIIYLTALYTSCRRGEILSLSWNNIDLENKIIDVKYSLVTKTNAEVEFTTPKTVESTRTIFIGDTLTAALKEYKKWQTDNIGECEYLCMLNPNKMINKYNIGAFTRRIQDTLNLKHFHIHQLRHYSATAMIEAGANPKDVQVRLGHSKIGTTLDTYVKTTEKLKNETVGLLEKSLL